MVFLLDKEKQRQDLISNWTADSNRTIDVLIVNNIKNTSDLISFVNSDLLFEHLLKIADKKKIKLESDSSFPVLIYESLKEGKLIDTNTVEYSIKDYMAFQIDNTIIADKMIELSFESCLDKSGLHEKNRLIQYIKAVNTLKKTSQKYFYIPFINVCQSSGSGKSKIATELMKEFPASYIVLREESDKYSFPTASSLSRLFMLYGTDSNLSEDFSSTSEKPSLSIVGRYLLLLKALFKDYLDNIKSLASNEAHNALKNIAKQFVAGKFMGHELELLKNNNFDKLDIDPKTLNLMYNSDLATISIEKVINACNNHLAEIYKLTVNTNNIPFVLIIDEASLLTDESSRKTSLFRLFRRSVHSLGLDNDFVVITLGTNSDIVDLNPGPTVNSFRESREGKLFPLFTINRIWDIYFNYDDLKKYPIGYYSMRCGKMLTFLFSLGRPVWSSIKLSNLVFFAERKATNGSLKSGEAYLAFWMIRTGLSTNPAHVINSYLISSLMATLLFVSPSLDYMRVDYPSEPALAIAARKKLDCLVDLKNYYQALEKFIQMRAIDQGKFSELISIDITLRAISAAESVSCDWVNELKLPSVCSTRNFILEKHLSEDIMEEEQVIKKVKISSEKEQEGEERINLISSADRANLKDEKRDYRIATVKSFLIQMYGKSSYDQMKQFIPNRLKSGLINTSHFVQFHRDFPKNVDGISRFNLGKAETSSSSSPCDILSSQALGAAVARGTGIICPPNYFGLDYAIPVVLKPLGDQKSREEDQNMTGSVSKKSNLKQSLELDLEKLIISKSLENTATTLKDSVGSQAVNLDYIDLNNSSESEDESDSGQFEVKEDDFEAVPEYTFIGVQVKRGLPGSIKKTVAKGAISNHFVKCGIHAKGQCPETCNLRIPEDHYEDILRNSLMLVHSMSGGSGNEKEREQPSDIKFDCQHSSSIEGLPDYYKNNISMSECKSQNLTDSECRFSPDVYLSGQVKKDLSLHVMFKKRVGFTERLTAIHSTGLSVFNQSGVLPEDVAEIASRIILNDKNVFSEVSPKAIYTWEELITSSVARSNDGKYPIASNVLRSSYEQELIERKVPDYSNLSFSTLQYFGLNPDEETKGKGRGKEKINCD